MASIGYERPTIIVLPNQGSWLIAERRGYVPQSFVPPKEAPVQISSGVALHQWALDGGVDYAFLTRPEERVSLEEMAANAKIISSKIFPEKSADSRWGKFVIAGLAVGAAAGAATVVYSPIDWESSWGSITVGVEAFLGAWGAERLYNRLLSRSQSKGVEKMHNPEKYFYGHDAAISRTLTEIESAREEAAIAGAYQVATESGLSIELKAFQSAWYSIKRIEATHFGTDLFTLLKTPHLDQVREAIQAHEQASRSTVTP